MNSKWFNGFAIVAVILAAALVAFGNLNSDTSNRILNVSYDATREVFKDLNDKFISKYQKDTGHTLVIQQTHGESAKQAQAVVNGLKADVVTLALGADVDTLHNRGLISEGWAKRLPNNSQPYSSTIVFVVHRNNPKAIADWQDLIKPGVTVVSAGPEGSASNRLSLMAAYGSVVYRGGDEDHARHFVGQLRKHLIVPANVSATPADVQLAWESEALARSDKSNGELQIVYPAVSIRSAPSVAWVDADVSGTRKEAYAKAYLQFLYTEQAQEIIAQHDLRPVNAAVLKRHAARLPALNLFPATLVSANWDTIQVANLR